MIIQTAYQAQYARTRLPIDRTWILVVVLLSGLFASAISVALTPRPLVDATLAASEGGL